MTHSHEWHVVDDGAFVYEDTALHITETCDYARKKAVGTSERLDETFYKTVEECTCERMHRFDVTCIEREHPVSDNPADRTKLCATHSGCVEFLKENREFGEAFDEAISERLQEVAQEFVDWGTVDTSDRVVTVELDGDDYRVTFSHDGTTRV